MSDEQRPTIRDSEQLLVQCHHGGGLWVWEGDDPEHGKPFLLRNLAGVEWSSQFAADPRRIDLLRQNAAKLYGQFPRSLAKLDAMGAAASAILAEPITDAAGIARWTDSLFNASIPLPAEFHTGVLPKAGGVHHYPAPVVEIGFFKRDDFALWVTDPQGHAAAVVPVTAAGSPDRRVMVVWASPETELGAQHAAAQHAGKALLLAPDHPIARAAFQQANPAERLMRAVRFEPGYDSGGNVVEISAVPALQQGDVGQEQRAIVEREPPE